MRKHKRKNKILIGAAATLMLMLTLIGITSSELFQGRVTGPNSKPQDAIIYKLQPYPNLQIERMVLTGGTVLTSQFPQTPPQVNPAPLENVPVSFAGPNGLTLTARLYKPQGTGPFPAVVLMHGCSGPFYGANVSSQFTYWGQRLKNEENMVTLLVDSFTPRGISDVCGNGSLLNEATERPKDAYAGLAYLRTLPYVKSQKIAIMGWSNGASATLSSVAKNNNPVPLPPQGGFVTAIANYPGCGLRSHYGTDYSSTASSMNGTYLPYVSTLILAGQNDATTPPSPKCVNLTNRAQQLGASTATNNAITLTIYPGAKHGFDRAKENDSTWTQSDLSARDLSRTTIVNHLRSFLN